MRITEQRAERLPYRFQQEAIALLHELVPISSSAFYLVNPNMQHKGIVLDGIDKSIDKSYRNYYKDLDPAHPSHFENSSETVVCLEDILGPTPLRRTIYYQEFLKPMRIEHVADMFFRHEGKIIAVITMLREASLGRFQASEVKTLKTLHRFLEYSINTVYFPERVSQRQVLTEKYKLTERELDVLEWIIAGMENKIIARELDVEPVNKSV